MDFSFTDVQDDARGLARTILDRRVTHERLKEIEASESRIDSELWSEFGATNLIGLALPEEVGGSGYGIMELAVLLEEVGRRLAPIPLYSTVCLAGLPIAQFGTDDQRKRLLAPVVEGTSILTAGLEESGRTDPLDPVTMAVPDGSRWRLDGLKVAVPQAPLADRILVSARTGPDSVGLFLVDPGAAGVGIESAFTTHRELVGHVTLDGAVVEEQDVLGPPLEGEQSLRFTYLHGLAGLCAMGAGLVEEAVRITAAYISEREQFEKPIATFQGATLRAADAFIDTQAVSVTTWSAIWRLAEGRAADDALAIAKFWVADGGQRVVNACQHLHGGIGVDLDYPIHRYFLWAKALELMLGGASAQLLRVGAALAGEAGGTGRND